MLRQLKKIFILIVFLLFLSLPSVGRADNTSNNTGPGLGDTLFNSQATKVKLLDEADTFKPQPAIHIPGLTFSDIKGTIDEDGNIHIPWIGEYIAAIYKFAVGIASIIAVIMIIISGVKIVTSGGGEEQAAAYHRIGQVITGLVILWGSYLVLNTINPNLTQFQALSIQYIKPVPLIDVIDEPVTAEPPETGVNNVPMYKQFDSKWGSTKYGYDSTCTTIAQAGCGPTSLAMVLSAYGTNATPDQTASYMGQKGNGRVCNRGTSMELTVSVLSKSPWSQFAGQEVSKSKALDLLKNKHPIIFLCHDCTGQGQKGPKHYNGHYMVLTGFDNQGNVTVNDPGANDTKAIQTMTDSQLDKNGGFWYIYPNSSAAQSSS